MAADHFCLRWNNYQSNMVTELDSLRSDEDLVDVTLSCEGHLLKAHKVILSACSSYFRNVFKDNPCKHPVVILKDVSYEDVEALLSFVYQGVVYISEKKLASFLQTAELLQIRGLTGAATTMKDGSFSGTTATQNKIIDKGNVPPPPQLLTANVINSWKQQGINTTTSSLKSPSSNPSSPSVPVSKRRKCVPNKVAVKDNFECSDTNSNQGCSETESDLVIVKQENNTDSENREAEDDCNSVGDISREESSREGNPSFYDNNMESDETEEEIGEIRNKTVVTNSDKSGNSNASCSNLFGMLPNYTSQSSAENSSIPGSHLAQCGNCPHCGQIYSNQSALKYHVRLMHCDLTNQFSCYLCPMSFTHRDDYKAHMWEIHKIRRDTRLGRRPCPLCQKIISNKSNLLKHMRIRHSDEYNPAGCTICNKVFKNKYSLRAHINIYHREMNSSGSCLSLSTSYPSYSSSSDYDTQNHHHQHQQQEPSSGNVNMLPDYVGSQSSVSLLFSPTSTSNYNNMIVSSMSSNLSSCDLIRENVMNQFNVSNSPLT